MTVRFHIRDDAASAPTWQDVETDADGIFNLPDLEPHQFVTYGQVLAEESK
jgi:hypothetical protein